LSSSAPSLNRVDPGTELFIDALRGVAALLVFAAHAFDLAISRVHGWSFGENPAFWRVIRTVFGTGEQWVWCFFVISGFCIHLSIARGLRQGRFRVMPYILARMTRIYPLFLAGLALAVVTYLVVPRIGGFDGPAPERQFWATLLSLQIFTNTFPSYEASWSLSCEMIFYAAWPALLLVARLSARPAYWIGMIGSLLAVAAILILWSRYRELEGRAFVGGIFTLSALFPLWLCGAWLAAEWDRLSSRVTRRLWLGGMAGLAAAMAFLWVLRYQQFPVWSVLVCSWIALPGIFLLIAGARHARLDAAPEQVRAACRWLGQLSYPCYVLHVQLQLLVDHFVVALLPELWAAMPMVRVAVYFAVILPPLALMGPPLERVLMAWRASLIKAAGLRSAVVTA
jgi:peptidoglycan/LPS O-acetylase OafA/YrhL